MSASLQSCDERTIAAARWLASHVEPVSHAVPVLKELFQLSGLQACQAIALARDLPSCEAIETSRRGET